VSEALDNLVRIGQLAKEPPSEAEIDGLVASAEARLRDAENQALSLESRFDLLYNVAHALALASLRSLGYRSKNRYIVFQATVHTLGMKAPETRVLSDAHRKRNQLEYEGLADVTEELVSALHRVTLRLVEEVQAMRSTEGTSEEDTSEEGEGD
jgi:hypothetical protein